MPNPDEDTVQHVSHSLASCYQSFYRRFTEHPRKERMTYCRHLFRTLYTSYQMAKGSLSLLIHAIYPAALPYHGEMLIKDLYYDQLQRSA